MVAAACQSCQGFRPEKKVYKVCHRMQSPYRLVVRTSRCGRDNPGSTPGGDIWMLRGCELAIPKRLQGPSKVLKTNLQGSRRARKNVRGSCRYFASEKSPTCELTEKRATWFLDSKRTWKTRRTGPVAADILCLTGLRDSIDAPVVL